MPDLAELSQTWRELLAEARRVVDLLPVDQIGTCALRADGNLFTGSPDDLRTSLEAGRVRFHPGSIRGAFPTVTGRASARG